MNEKKKNIIQYGDFQTPLALATEVIEIVLSQITDVKTVIEPTCGTGTFLQAILESPLAGGVKQVLGFEINPEYVTLAREKLAPYNSKFPQVEIKEQDFFDTDWEKVMKEVPKPVLFLGNPPWVTNSQIGKIKGANVPQKMNFKGARGLDAMTGCGNFDISEWMLIKLLSLVENTDSALAFLVKTSVARKVFEYSCTKGMVSNTQIRRINAKTHFNVNVDAALFLMGQVKSNNSSRSDCEGLVYESLQSSRPTRHIGVINGNLVADTRGYKKWQWMDASSPFQWRSGVKHDCAKVMELTRLASCFLNGLGEWVQITEEYVYPILKSSDVAKGVTLSDKCVIIPQKYIGEATEPIAENSPSTWQYLKKHAKMFENRKSSIYRNAPQFAIFGIGNYSFKQWKVAVSGLYKDFHFCLIPPHGVTPVMLDDTCYFLGFDTEEVATLIHELLASEAVSEFLDSTLFKDEKRPITSRLLNRIDLTAVAKMYQKQYRFDQIIRQHTANQKCFEMVLE